MRLDATRARSRPKDYELPLQAPEVSPSFHYLLLPSKSATVRGKGLDLSLLSVDILFFLSLLGNSLTVLHKRSIRLRRRRSDVRLATT